MFFANHAKSVAQKHNAHLAGFWVEFDRETKEGKELHTRPGIVLIIKENMIAEWNDSIPGKPRQGKYNVKNNKLYFDGKVIDIEKVTKDSLVLVFEFKKINQRSVFLRKEKIDSLNKLKPGIGNMGDGDFAVEIPVKKDDVYLLPEEPARFTGDKDFIKQNLKWPTDANIQGTVVVSFIVEKDGSLTNIEVVKSLEKDFDAEAIRVLKLMPKWIPAKDKGEIVRSKITYPVRFKNP